MKKIPALCLLLITLQSQSQSVAGYWYGYANVKTGGSANNYMIEMVLSNNRGLVSGMLNYYFKNTYRSIIIKGNYNEGQRQLNIYDIPVTYFGSIANFEVDCIMNLRATMLVARNGNSLSGELTALPGYQYTCPNVIINLSLNAAAGNIDSVLLAIRHFKETFQVWRPSAIDTLAPLNILQRKVVNYVIEKAFTERENKLASEIEVESDSLTADFYDNGEIDGDSISVFFNNRLLTFNRILSTRAVHFDLQLDSLKTINEISLFADNLGSLPPNTALMVIRDGKNRFEIRLSSSLDKNALVRIRRKFQKK